MVIIENENLKLNDFQDHNRKYQFQEIIEIIDSDEIQSAFVFHNLLFLGALTRIVGQHRFRSL